ncbi:MAG: asparagine synthase (glutamine-hydrolyzing) [Candidatus Pacebacteria bacterium]|nr:asparagine synthase (glutamine-hydrolyzing) [Candidatus Paceibacterota bacterium]
MCGIVGSNGKNRKGVERGLVACAHRGPDARGMVSVGEIVLGHNRLAILDVDPRSNQPMTDGDGLYVVFNGEIYNYEALKRERLAGTTFRTTCDTEVLLHMYRKYGTQMATYLQGMYAFAILDTRLSQVHLFSDHTGIKPLYFYFDGTRLAFASETRAVMEVLRGMGVNPALRHDHIDLFVVLGYLPTPLTLFEGVRHLEPATVWSLDLKTLKERTEKIETQCRTLETEQALANLIEEKVLGHLIADVPVGVYFSGGTDSSLIASILHAHHVDLQTFSIRMEGRSEDQHYFEAIADHLDLKRNVYDFGSREFDEVYQYVVGKLDEPLADLALFPTYYLSKRASEQVKVVLSGEGGDELFYGYPRSRVLWDLHAKRDPEVGLLETLYMRTPRFPAKNKLFEEGMVRMGLPYAYYLEHMTPSRDLSPIAGWRAWKELMAVRAIEPPALDRELYLPDLLLRKMDLATSYASIEGRVPLLDPEVMHNAPLVAHLFREGTMLKPFLKDMLRAYLPPELVYRGKSGFGYSYARFYEKSALLRDDVQASVEYLENTDIVPRGTRVRIDRYMRTHPNYVFALTMLAHSIWNCTTPSQSPPC